MGRISQMVMGRLPALVVLVAACVLSFDEVHDVRPIDDLAVLLDVSVLDVDPSRAEADALNVEDSAARLVTDAANSEERLAKTARVAEDAAEKARAAMGAAENMKKDLTTEVNDSAEMVKEDTALELKTGQEAVKAANAAATAKTDVEAAQGVLKQVSGQAGHIKVLSEEEVVQLKAEQVKMDPLRTAMVAATNAFKDSEHKVRILRGEVSRDSTRADYERQQDSDAKNRMLNAQRDVDAANAKMAATQGKHEQAKAEEAAAKADLDKARQAQANMVTAAKKAEADLAAAIANGTATDVMKATAKRLREAATAQKLKVDGALRKLTGAAHKTKMAAQAAAHSSEQANSLGRLADAEKRLVTDMKAKAGSMQKSKEDAAAEKLSAQADVDRTNVSLNVARTNAAAAASKLATAQGAAIAANTKVTNFKTQIKSSQQAREVLQQQLSSTSTDVDSLDSGTAEEQSSKLRKMDAKHKDLMVKLKAALGQESDQVSQLAVFSQEHSSALLMAKNAESTARRAQEMLKKAEEKEHSTQAELEIAAQREMATKSEVDKENRAVAGAKQKETIATNNQATAATLAKKDAADLKADQEELKRDETETNKIAVDAKNDIEQDAAQLENATAEAPATAAPVAPATPAPATATAAPAAPAAATAAPAAPAAATTAPTTAPTARRA